MTFEQIFANCKILPVVVINDVTAAKGLADTLLESGINSIEVTMRTPNALKIIELLAKEVPEIIVGAGTIKNTHDFNLARNAGAKYIISPGLTESLLQEASKHKDTLFLPGIITPSEALLALEYNCKHLKFFPAENYNGQQVLKSLASVLDEIKFCPTGGININNMSNYLRLPNVMAIGMSEIVEKSLIANHDFTKIKELASKAVQISQQI